MAAVTICSDFGAPKNKVWHCFYCFPIYFPWNDGTECHDLHFLEKTIALTRRTFVGKAISLLFNMLSRLATTFLPKCKHLLISWLQSPSAVILEPQKNKVWHCFYCFPIYLPWSDGTECHDLHFLNVELKANFHSPLPLSSRGFLVPLHFLP